MLSVFENRLPPKLKYEIALEHYDHHGDFYPIIRKYVRQARIARPENWREALPSSVRDLETFTIYRGGGEDIGKAKYSLSWTLSQETAEWFMKRHELSHPDLQHLYRGTIAADKVIAYFDSRGEYEIVQYRGVRNITEIPPAGISPEYEVSRGAGSPFSLPDPKQYHIYFDRWYRKTHPHDGQTG